mmetsp:Transcript_21269/g.57238  ORF Transcript_21269/g.57238 Transcript_21269/m.57238 type:complete len:331 (+) Transcript_21269:56-1048(+)|eukprot:CAMPEP_0185169770 /NCGR_PEP_ID=MMETSP1139-20130426/17738_1 /TAXON_ID=298111 /ORGANISM="Pavlova sp., Strain CCMP459" /LENGTH=330 /DNA_ID=CAMNT_0027735315 /DNA_START=30 /DNA_END=1022 /DNA_ORIENTATION=-
MLARAARLTTSHSRSLATLVVAEHASGSLNDATLNAITAASKLGSDTHVLVIGDDYDGPAAAAAGVEGVTGVTTVKTAANPVSEELTAAVLAAHKAGAYSHILAPSTAMGKSVMPRVAALLDVSAVTEVLSVESEDTFSRPIYAGNAISTVKVLDPIKVLTIRPTAFDKAPAAASPAPITPLDGGADAQDAAWFVGQELSKSERPELSSASAVVAGGRGLKSLENFKLLEQLADRLGAALGASRAAVDAGFAPNDWQVGQTGKVVAPDLYVAVGISGAIQHLAGMKDSKTIVAINTDPDAPIFQVSDYGVVDDLFTVCPALDDKLKEMGK